MVLQLSAQQFQVLTRHASRTYPEECCGILLGHFSPDRTLKQVVEIWETANDWNPEVGQDLAEMMPQMGTGKRDRYSIAPQDLFAAQRYARDHSINIIGIYHSHPDHAAVPSESDRLLAWSAYVYLILSVQSGVIQDHRAWMLENQYFQPEAVQIR